jgi:hypothetical protein
MTVLVPSKNVVEVLRVTAQWAEQRHLFYILTDNGYWVTDGPIRMRLATPFVTWIPGHVMTSEIARLIGNM